MPFSCRALLPTIICASVPWDGCASFATSTKVCLEAPLEHRAQKPGHALLQLELPSVQDAKAGQATRRKRRQWFTQQLDKHGRELVLASQFPQVLPMPTNSSLGVIGQSVATSPASNVPINTSLEVIHPEGQAVTESLLGNSPGTRVSISEEGFEEIKKLNCRKEMAEFTRRTVLDMGYEICQEGGLQGTVGYYFQVSSKKTFNDLKMDIKAGSASQCPWIGTDGLCQPLSANCPSVQDKGASHRRRSCSGPPSASSVGSTSALDNTGFGEVKKLYCRLDMESFIRRTVDEMELEVCHEGGLQGLVSFYVENDVAQKTFEDLKKDIEMGTAGQCPWLGKDGNCPPMPKNCDGPRGTSAVEISLHTPPPDSAQVDFAIANASAADVGTEGSLQEQAQDSNPVVLSLLERQRSQGPSGSGAGLSEKGFEQIKSLSSREDMEEFARRTVIDLGYEVCHQGGLEGAIENYFQLYSNKTFLDLKDQIQAGLQGSCPWVAKDGKCPPPSEDCHNIAEPVATNHRRRSCSGPPNWNTMAAYAKLNQSAFEEIKEMHCQVEMNLFSRRLINFMGYSICHEGGFLHLVSFYVNTNISTWTFNNLKEDIKNGTKGECPWLSGVNETCIPNDPGCAKAFRESHRRRSCVGRKD
mmetsp:Transcript_126461/g.224112  ORF Transcript_126461/g.224112 Transcript_126461/m.224112 type:complete len:642 (-) Transcript_126461:99-2024(-)